MFKVKKIEIDAAHHYRIVLHEQDAQKLRIFPNDRARIRNCENEDELVCEVEILDCEKHCILELKGGEVGCYERVYNKLNLKSNGHISITPAKKPHSLEHIKKKYSGKKLNQEEFKEILCDIVENRFSEIETTYFVIACSAHKLDDLEVIALTNAMVEVGTVLNFKEKKDDIIVDKHCIGGIAGNRTTMVVIPIIASAGLIIPKTSSRAITSPAGTADTMEVLTNVSITSQQLYNNVKEIGACLVWGGGLDLSPADDLIIHIEHPLEIDSEGQMIASVLSKKKSVGSTHVLIDIPVGPTAKVKTMDHAIHLKKRFEKIGEAIGLKMRVVITDAKEPIGNGIGPLYEAQDVLKVLAGESGAPKDLRDKSLELAAELFEMTGTTQKGRGLSLATHILDSGIAHEKFKKIIETQGKNNTHYKAQISVDIRADKNGKISAIHNRKISKIAYILGAPQDKAAGLYLHKKLGENVKKGDVLFTMHSNSQAKISYANKYLEEKGNPYEL